MSVHRCFLSKLTEPERICRKNRINCPGVKACRDVPNKTCSCNCCQRGFYKVLN
ncbi:hypothetical protein LDENG_00183400 [Lucifuga dentata]|nr:hypothetical protein LDENG_00183400 [Lucifuga dentata]